MGFRFERDTMGEVGIPEEALYGPQTQRAVENFPISGLQLPPPFLRALALLKACAAHVTNQPEIAAAAELVAAGNHLDQFPVDVFQTGSGTSTNMNMNEVLAHLAGRGSGRSFHPNDDVNRGQSSNDLIPSALHVAAAVECGSVLVPALDTLEAALRRRAGDFQEIVKIARTHLQDAVPMTLGQEFGGYARQVELARGRIEQALTGLLELPLGGTAAGTGLNAPPGFAAAAIARLAERTGLPFTEAANHFEAQASRDAVCHFSGALRACAVALWKIANDIRWLGSGPRCGLGEIRLPAVQPGSSIMPGKVNPVIAESLMMVCAQVAGYDAAIAWAAGAGNFELNAMMPLMAYDLLEQIRILAAGARNFAARCIEGLEADPERIRSFVEGSLAMVTALVPEIGYDRAAAIAKQAYASGRTIREVAHERSGIPSERLAALLDPRAQAGLVAPQ